MKPEKILVPLDTARCPVEVFARINALAQRGGVEVELLHVVNLNLAAPDRRVDDEVCAEAQWHLERLREEYVDAGAKVVTRVRMGRPGDEILAEAKEQEADLIVVPTGGSAGGARRTWWSCLWAAVCPGVVGRLLRYGWFPLLIVHGETWLNCHRRWGRRHETIEPGLGRLRPEKVDLSVPLFSATKLRRGCAPNWG
jgi:nucleotide-binding universal stress UspA family protein